MPCGSFTKAGRLVVDGRTDVDDDKWFLILLVDDDDDGLYMAHTHNVSYYIIGWLDRHEENDEKCCGVSVCAFKGSKRA